MTLNGESVIGPDQAAIVRRTFGHSLIDGSLDNIAAWHPDSHFDRAEALIQRFYPAARSGFIMVVGHTVPTAPALPFPSAGPERQ